MRAVTGSVVSSRPISLSKASAVLSRFAANENAARPEVAAYVRRASTAFDDLVRFHREVRAARKRPELEKLLMEEEAERKKKKRKRSRGEPEAGDDGMPRAGADGENGEDTNLVEGDRDRRGGRAEFGSDGERKKKKRRKKADEEERSELAVKEEKNVVTNGNLVGKGFHYVDGTELREDEKRRKKKRKMVEEEETSSLSRKGEKKPEAEEEKHKHRKKKEKEKHKEDQKEEVVAEVLGGKHRKHSDIGEELVEPKDQKEQRKKKKKKNNKTED